MYLFLKATKLTRNKINKLSNMYIDTSTGAILSDQKDIFINNINKFYTDVDIEIIIKENVDSSTEIKIGSIQGSIYYMNKIISMIDISFSILKKEKKDILYIFDTLLGNVSVAKMSGGEDIFCIEKIELDNRYISKINMEYILRIFHIYVHKLLDVDKSFTIIINDKDIGKETENSLLNNNFVWISHLKSTNKYLVSFYDIPSEIVKVVMNGVGDVDQKIRKYQDEIKQETLEKLYGNKFKDRKVTSLDSFKREKNRIKSLPMEYVLDTFYNKSKVITKLEMMKG